MHNQKLTVRQWFVIFITMATTVLFCLSSALNRYTGDIGMVAMFPVVVFFGTGMLNTADFNNLLWSVIALAMGGIALGHAVSVSGLLRTVVNGSKNLITEDSPYVVSLSIAGITLVIATFVSHTVSAMILLPVFASVGRHYSENFADMLSILSSMAASAAMALPTSSFPSMTAVMMVDERGKRYLEVKDFLRVGIPSCIACFFVLTNIGFFITKAVIKQ